MGDGAGPGKRPPDFPTTLAQKPAKRRPSKDDGIVVGDSSDDEGEVIDWTGKTKNYCELYDSAIAWSTTAKANARAWVFPNPDRWQPLSFYSAEKRLELAEKNYVFANDALPSEFRKLPLEEKHLWEPGGLDTWDKMVSTTPKPVQFYASGDWVESPFYMAFRTEGDYLYWEKGEKIRIGPLLLGYLHHIKKEPWEDAVNFGEDYALHLRALIVFDGKFTRVPRTHHNLKMAVAFLDYLQQQAISAFANRIRYEVDQPTGPTACLPGHEEVITFDKCVETGPIDTQNKLAYVDLTRDFDEVHVTAKSPLHYYPLRLYKEISYGEERDAFVFMVQGATNSELNLILYTLNPDSYRVARIDQTRYSKLLQSKLFDVPIRSPLSWGKFIVPTEMCECHNDGKIPLPGDLSVVGLGEEYFLDENKYEVFDKRTADLRLKIDGFFVKHYIDNPEPKAAAGILGFNNHTVCMFSINGVNWYMADPWKSPSYRLPKDSYPNKLLELWLNSKGKTFEHLNVVKAQYSSEGSCAAVALMRMFIAANEISKLENPLAATAAQIAHIKAQVTGLDDKLEKIPNWAKGNACFALLAYRMLHIYRFRYFIPNKGQKIIRPLEQIVVEYVPKLLAQGPKTYAELKANFDDIVVTPDDEREMQAALEKCARKIEIGGVQKWRTIPGALIPFSTGGAH